MASPGTGPVPHNLPSDLTAFIGREREIAQVSGFLGRTRLLTLIGAGGAGKSRLAFRVAVEALGEFPDGVWVTELASLADPALVAHRVSTALEISEQSGRDVTATLADALDGKTVLLVLDNCEHLAGACAALAAALLRECPNLRILATSRVPLSAPGETLWRVPSLTLPASAGRASLEEIGRSEAVRLFIERTRAREPAFALDAANAADVVQICRRLDGMPLAIVLAAARAGVLSAAQIAARLDDRFRLLTGGAAAALPRHQTLRATMDWSHALLGERERAVLRRLSVFAGGWTLEAAEEVCAGDGVPAEAVLDSLGRLVDGSLVTASTDCGAARYNLLETVRQYGAERLAETDEEPQVRRRHLEWYLAFAEEGDRGLHGPEDILWLGRLEREHDNLLAALEFARRCGDGGASEARLAAALEWFWHVAGFWAEGRARLDGVLARASGAPAFLPKVYVGAARLAYRRGDRARAAALCADGHALSRRVGDRLNEACCLLWLGILAMADGDPLRAEPLLTESLGIYRAIDNRWWTVEALSFLGGAAVMRGAYGQAQEFYEECLAVASGTGNLENLTMALRPLARQALRRGDDEQATAYYADILRRIRDAAAAAIDSPNGREGGRAGPPPMLMPGIVTECLDGLARVAGQRGAHAPAAKLFGAVDASYKRLGGGLPQWSDIAEHERYVAAARQALGEAHFAAERDAGAKMSLEEAVAHALAVTTAVTPSGTSADRAAEAGPPGPTESRGTRAGPLTARERQVAALIAQGLTNRQIATALVVTERTAETHVQNILNKLGFTSRTQIAAWAVAQSLTLKTREP